MYDAIVVGARCAGSPLAMLLARRAHRVLLLDRARFPSDTVSTHYIHQPGVARLKRWGLLDRLRATGLPSDRGHGLGHRGDQVRRPPSDPRRRGGGLRPTTHRPGRDAGQGRGGGRSGAPGGLHREGDRSGRRARRRDPRPGAGRGDGRRARTSRRRCGRAAVDGGSRGRRRALRAALAEDSCVLHLLGRGRPRPLGLLRPPGLGAAAFPTNDGLAMVSIVFSTFDYPDGVRGDIEGNYLAGLQRFRSLAEKVLAGKRVERFAGMHRVPNRFRRSAGSGWALVGDAGYHKDPAAAQGITDAFRDAEALAEAIDRGLSDPPTLDAELETYARTRDEAVMPWFRWALRVARLEALTPPARQLYEAIAADQEWSNRFCGLNAETVDPDTFFSGA